MAKFANIDAMATPDRDARASTFACYSHQRLHDRLISRTVEHLPPKVNLSNDK